MDVTDVDQPPAYTGCSKGNFKCSLQKITSYLMENINPKILAGLNKEDTFINLKVVIDDKGEVKKVLAQGKNKALKAEAVRVTKTLPHLIPAVHEGKKVNVILDIPLQLESTDPLPFKSKLYDTPAVAVNCKDEKDPLLCTSRFVQNFIHQNYRTNKIKSEEEFIKVIFNFTIDENGRPINIQASGNNQSLKEEGIRTINTLPNFIPATKDGKKIPVTYSFPVTLSIQKFK